METLYLNKEGRWYHEGIEITHEKTCSLFYRHLSKEGDGRYYIRIGNEIAKVAIEDAPYVVRSVHVSKDPKGTISDYKLLLSDGSQELLDPRTLFVGKRNVLYCRVKDGNHLARFSRPAYQLLCSHLQYDEENDRYWIPWREMPMFINDKNGCAG